MKARIPVVLALAMLCGAPAFAQDAMAPAGAGTAMQQDGMRHDATMKKDDAMKGDAMKSGKDAMKPGHKAMKRHARDAGGGMSGDAMKSDGGK